MEYTQLNSHSLRVFRFQILDLRNFEYLFKII
jgi:hypothetical protein